MLACIRWLAESGGGFVVASEGEVRARLPLPFAGLLSLDGADAVCDQLEEVIRPPRWVAAWPRRSGPSHFWPCR